MKMYLCVFAFFSLASLNANLNDRPHITLTANASILKPADELQLKIGVVSLAETAEAALSDNTLKMKQILENLNHIGFDTDEYETHQFSIRPNYTPYPTHPPQNWKAEIIGYEVTNSILLHTQKLELIGQVIDVTTKSGANSISDIKFGLKNPQQYKSEVLSLAGQNAIKEAEIIAKATGVQLIRILSIQLNQMRVHSPQLQLACFAKSSGADNAAPIEAGDLSLEASITLIYEIQ